MQNLHRALLTWFDRNARDLPWRHTHDPYGIWVSEVMLQQTQVATVKSYFEKFWARFPTVQDLADADEADVLRLWEGLGYYRRARQLHRAAKVVVQEYDGVFPTEMNKVLALPGIGRYTAGAILSIAFDQRQPILEGNTIRVYSRLIGYRDDPRTSQGQRALWEFAEHVLPRKRCGAFNQAMMELGSEVCVPQNPDCQRCPLRRYCPTRENGWQGEIPAPATRKIRYQDLHETAVIVRRKNQVLLRQCGEQERWAGLWDFPRFITDKEPKQRFQLAKRVQTLTGVDVEIGEHVTTIKHSITRFRITLTCYQAEYRQGRLRRNGGCQWVTPQKLTEMALSVTGRKLARGFAAGSS